jgi:hypothetical protein
MKQHDLDMDHFLSQCIDWIERDGTTVEECLDRFPDMGEGMKSSLLMALRLRRGHDLHAPLAFRKDAVRNLERRLELSERRPHSAKRWNTAFMTLFSSPIIGKKSAPSGPRVLRYATIFLSTLLVLTALTVSVANASDLARPGDVLYGIDRAIENLRLGLSTDAEQKASLQMQYASERLEEASDLIVEGKTIQAGIALEDYSQTIQAAAPIISGSQINDQQSETIRLLTGDALLRHEGELEALLELAPSSSQAIIKGTIEEVKILRGTVAPSPSGEDVEGEMDDASEEAEGAVVPQATPESRR